MDKITDAINKPHGLTAVLELLASDNVKSFLLCCALKMSFKFHIDFTQDMKKLMRHKKNPSN